MLTNGDLDHCLGLLSLRESHPLVVYATDAVRDGFREGNVLFRTLERFPDQVTWRRARARPRAAARRERRRCASTAVPVPGKLPIHLEGRARAVARGQRRPAYPRRARRRALAYFSGGRRGRRRRRCRARRARTRVLRRHVLVRATS